MIRKSTLFMLFLVSYIPLFLILAIQNINDICLDKEGIKLGISQIMYNNLMPICLILLSVIAFLAYIFFIKINARGGFRPEKKITAIKNNGVEYLSYLATYIIPFIGLKFDSWNNILATSVLFIVIGFIYTKTNLLYANPTLALFGFYINQITFADGEECTSISHGKITIGKYYKYKVFNQDIIFLKTK